MTAVKQIEASARAQVGKGAARAVRRQGQTPAVIYGGGAAPEAIAVRREALGGLSAVSDMRGFLQSPGYFCSTRVEVAGPSPMISSTTSSSLAPS